MKKIEPQHVADLLLQETYGKSTSECSEIVKGVARLIHKYRLNTKVNEIISEYYSLYNKKLNIKEVTLTLQERLSIQRKNSLKNELKTILKCSDIFLIEKVDERIMGGIIIETNDGIYIDGTVKGRLNQLREVLTR